MVLVGKETSFRAIVRNVTTHPLRRSPAVPCCSCAMDAQHGWPLLSQASGPPACPAGFRTMPFGREFFVQNANPRKPAGGDSHRYFICPQSLGGVARLLGTAYADETPHHLQSTTQRIMNASKYR